MQIHVVVAIRDSCVDAFLRPFFVRSVAEAVRSFGDEIQRDDCPMKAHPEHFELFELGTFQDSQAVFVLLERPRSIALAVDFIPRTLTAG